MPARQRHDGTHTSTIDSLTREIARATILTTGSGLSDFTWPTIAACAMLFGFVVAVNLDGAPTFVGAVDQLHWLFAWCDRVAEPDAEQALIVTANRRDQLTAVATLSPRGFYPLLASNEREVVSQIRAHPGTLRLAVVDDTLPDYAFIARALKGTLPIGSIIVLQRSHRSEDLGPMLLDRLGVLKSKRPPPKAARLNLSTSLCTGGQTIAF